MRRNVLCTPAAGIKNRKSAREHYKGDRDGLSNPEVLIGLIKVINPDYDPPRLERIRR